MIKLDNFEALAQEWAVLGVVYWLTFVLLHRSLDLTLSDITIGNMNYVQSCPMATMGRILFVF